MQLEISEIVANYKVATSPAEKAGNEQSNSTIPQAKSPPPPCCPKAGQQGRFSLPHLS